MKYFLILLLFFLINCSFDNKSGIWKDSSNQNNIENSSIFKDFKKVTLIKKDTFNEIVKFQGDYNFLLNSIQNTQNWNEAFYNKSNTYVNFAYNNANKILFKSKKLTKHLTRDKVLFSKDFFITTDIKGNIIFYSVKNKENFKNKKIAIFGGGDSALDWALELSKFSKITLIHRRNEFRGAQHTLSELKKLEKEGKVLIKTPCQIESLDNTKELKSITIKFDDGKIEKIQTDVVLGFFGLIMKLGPIAEWGLNMDKKTIEVNPENFETNKKGIFAAGDICSYPGKLRLILSGFHEVALASVQCFKRARPNEKYRFEFTTSSKTIKERLGKK